MLGAKKRAQRGTLSNIHEGGYQKYGENTHRLKRPRHVVGLFFWKGSVRRRAKQSHTSLVILTLCLNSAFHHNSVPGPLRQQMNNWCNRSTTASTLKGP